MIKNNVVEVTYKLLRNIKVNVNKNRFSLNLETHSKYPIMLAISDCLNEINVENITYKISNENYDSSKFKSPFLAHLWINGGIFIAC